MKFVCDASPALTWFRLETEAEAARESIDMNHAVERHFVQARDSAAAAWKPPSSARYIEQDIGKTAFIERAMPMFLTLRDANGIAVVTAMLPVEHANPLTRAIVVGHNNSDPYTKFAAAIRALSDHLKINLDRERCFPYRRG